MHDITNPVAQAAREYVAAGWALVPIPRGSKGPNTKGWNQRGRCVTDPEVAARLAGNIGLAHAQSGTCVLDLDKLLKARAWFKDHAIDLDAYLEAIDAVRISSGREDRAKLLYALPAGCSPLATVKLDDVGIEFRCADSKGLTVQDVLPPSIHPDTQQPYRWEYNEPLVAHWTQPPEIPVELVGLWRNLLNGSVKRDPPRAGEAPDADDPFASLEPPLGLSHDELNAVLKEISASEYDTWLRVGMALHHETGGEPRGLDLWNEWSENADNYAGLPDLTHRWEGFGQGGGAPITARWLLKMAKVAREKVKQDAQRSRFTPVPAHEFAAGNPPNWIVKGVLPQAELGVVYGGSGDGKTFFVLDLVGAICRGAAWRGLAVQQGRVVYVCAEGIGGFRSRLRAYAQQQACTLIDLPLFVVGDSPNFMADDDPDAIAQGLLDIGGADLLVIDTLAAVTPGANENAGEDMGAVLARCKALHAATGAMVLLIHHSGKDALRGARGWSGLRAAADVEIEISRLGDDRKARISKLKDGEDGAVFGFQLRPVLVSFGEDGEEITSCVVDHVEASALPAEGMQPRGKWERLILDALQELQPLGGDPVSVPAVIDLAVTKVAHDPDQGRDRRRECAKRAIDSLASDGHFELAENAIRLCHTPHGAT
ncbi:MAG TPA: AAA family ATPase [Thiobacillus sp.]